MAPGALSRPRAARIGRLVLIIAVELCATAGLVALWFHFYPPKLPLQTISPREWSGVTTFDGVPVWKNPRDDGQRTLCPDSPAPHTNILILSDSILYGSELPSGDTCGKFLEKDLNAEGRGHYCVLNYGQPALAFDAKHALARALLPDLRPRVLFWGVSWNELSRFVFIGDTAYEVGRRKRNPDGLPAAFPIPAAANAWLARHVPLYRYLALTLAPAVPDAELWEAYATRDLPLLEETVRQTGTKLVLVFCPPLDRDFKETANRVDPGYARVKEFAAKRNIQTISLAEEMIGQDYKAVRLDACCHFNRRGQELIADIFRRKTRKLLK